MENSSLKCFQPDGKIANALEGWLRDSMNYRAPSSSIIDPQEFELLCSGRLGNIWRHIISHVTTESQVKHVKGNLRLQRNRRESSSQEKKSDVEIDKQANLKHKYDETVERLSRKHREMDDLACEINQSSEKILQIRLKIEAAEAYNKKNAKKLQEISLLQNKLEKAFLNLQVKKNSAKVDNNVVLEYQQVRNIIKNSQEPPQSLSKDTKECNPGKFYLLLKNESEKDSQAIKSQAHHGLIKIHLREKADQSEVITDDSLLTVSSVIDSCLSDREKEFAATQKARKNISSMNSRLSDIRRKVLERGVASERALDDYLTTATLQGKINGLKKAKEIAVISKAQCNYISSKLQTQSHNINKLTEQWESNMKFLEDFRGGCEGFWRDIDNKRDETHEEIREILCGPALEMCRSVQTVKLDNMRIYSYVRDSSSLCVAPPSRLCLTEFYLMYTLEGRRKQVLEQQFERSVKHIMKSYLDVINKSNVKDTADRAKRHKKEQKESIKQNLAKSLVFYKSSQKQHLPQLHLAFQNWRDQGAQTIPGLLLVDNKSLSDWKRELLK